MLEDLSVDNMNSMSSIGWGRRMVVGSTNIPSVSVSSICERDSLGRISLKSHIPQQTNYVDHNTRQSRLGL